MKFVFKFIKPYWTGIIFSTMFIITATMCDLLLPTIMSDILDNGIYGQDFRYILERSLIMFIVAAIGLAATLIGSKLSCDVVAGFCYDVRKQVFLKVNTMSFEEFGRIGTAALVTRATHDVQTLSWVAAELAGTVFTIPVLFFGGFFLTLQKDLLVAMILLAFLPIVFSVVILIGKCILPLWDISDKYIDKQNDIMRERLRGIRVIRAFDAENIEHSKINHAIKTMTENIIKSNVSMGIVTPLAMFLLNFAVVLIVYVGGWRLETDSGLSGGDVFAIIQYIALVSSGVIMGAFTIITFPHAKVAAQRISQVLNAKGMDQTNSGNNIVINGDICFDDVTFYYEGAGSPALKNINIRVDAGQKVAIIGGTGAGKSSLVSLLLGFRKPSSGRIYLGDIERDEINIQTIRNSISCVLQNATMYSGTIGENIRMGKLNAEDSEVWDALKIAQAFDFVQTYEDGLNHVIKQSGKNLSGGQKQRLSIARAVIKDAPIYIFDDSFSALDFITEAKLRSALQAKLVGKTQIVITQRVTSAMHCDKIFVMDKGMVIDCGIHEELLSRCAVYREIYASQTGGEALEN